MIPKGREYGALQKKAASLGSIGDPLREVPDVIKTKTKTEEIVSALQKPPHAGCDRCTDQSDPGKSIKCMELRNVT